MAKIFIWIGLLVGSTLGGLIPLLWGDDVISMAGLALSTLGALVGIFAGYKISQSVGG